MNYSVTRKEATVDAGEFVARYRDVERFDALCAQCPSYGKVWCCPPFAFDPRTCSDGFKTVTVMGTVIAFDEEMRAACTTSDSAAQTAREAMEKEWEKLLPELYELERQVSGSRCFTFRCSLCPEGCTRPEEKPCRHPGQLRYSLEAVGFDIGAITRDLLGIELLWSTDGTLPEHVTLVTAIMRP